MTSQLSGYFMHKLTLEMNDQTLYAVSSLSFIQVDKDKVLYIDGSASYDSRYTNSQYLFSWGIEGYPSLVLPNTKILTLTPD